MGLNFPYFSSIDCFDFNADSLKSNGTNNTNV